MNLEPKSMWHWNKTVHASFRKVMDFDWLFFGLGVCLGIGIGAFLVDGRIFI